jgi:putative transposase
MPAKNVVKKYVENSYYHLYNRGVEKRVIFEDEQDYIVFLSYLKYLLTPSIPSPLDHPRHLTGSDLIRYRPQHNLHDRISLIAYCLMPNHFHLLIHQKTSTGITDLMRSLATSYSMYFNCRYHRVGALFQGKYKASLVDTEEYLLHLSRYIHLNPATDRVGPCQLNPREYPYSSYKYFIGWASADWIHPRHVLDYFPKHPISKKLATYADFVESAFESIIDAPDLGKLILEPK